ncbi:MAG TPA: vWA domain-containing protein [Planctomycetaceae bacterium]|jgi:Mg-chelatase subunit ChlD|nr:vWA domain-containing protein [Planctomycetaceae bacterium]
MIWFQYPEVLLLAIPVGIAYTRLSRATGVTAGLRIALLVALVAALAGPRLDLGGKGIDVIVVADRSRSMPPAAQDGVLALIHDLERNRKAGDRVGVVTFGGKAQIEHPLSDNSSLGSYSKEILPDGSDLADAISTSLNLVDKNRPARILVLSDGEANGPDPLSTARRAREEGVPIDYRPFERPRLGDVAVESIQLPDSVTPREPFQFTVDIYADRDVRGQTKVFRGSTLIANRDTDLVAGRNRLTFRDLLEQGGMQPYRVEVDVPGDPLVQNNVGSGVVFVDAGPRVLVLNSDGKEGGLGRALKSAHIPVDVAAAGQSLVSPDALDRYRAVVVENVPASALGRVRMEHLAQFVEDLGGGFLLTGGERSFGVGGYFKSPLDAILPVSMELRHEHRKNRVAIAIALDRSGSMAVPIGRGKTKMDLADLGTAECVRLLSAGDMVSVIAVDTVPHIIQPMGPVEDPEAICKKVLRIESAGGGIYIYEALVAAGEQLTKAEDYSTRHIILFADANDSEKPDDYKTLIKKFADGGITVSVIGLGTDHDSDSELLKDIAKRGGGQVMFADDPLELPRLFTQDTMNIARNTFIKKEEDHPQGILGRFVPEARLMGELGSGPFPNVDGYNLCYLKPEATPAVISADEYQAPWSAFWFRGLGRVAALTMEVDGRYSGQFARWDKLNDFLITHVRWLLSSASPDDVFLRVERAGEDAVATVELDPDRPDKSRHGPPTLIVVPPGAEREAAVTPDFIWTGPDTLEARFRMDRTGTYRTLLKTGERKFVRGPAVTLPYSPEFVPRVGLLSGTETLKQIGEISGGKLRTDVLEVLADPPRSASSMSLIPWLLGCAIGLLLTEIAGRRLALWERVSALIPEKEAKAEALEKAPALAARKWWDLPLPRATTRRGAGSTARTVPETSLPAANSSSLAQPAAEAATPAIDVFQLAKDRVRRRSQ